MADKNFNTVTVSGSINSSDYLHATIGGTHNRVLVSTLIAKAKAETLTEVEASLLDKLTDGCFIMYHILSSVPQAIKASSWTSLQNSGSVADGVLIVEGGRGLVVAPTAASTALTWSSAAKRVGSISNDFASCFSDFNGKSNTAAIMADETIGSDGSGYAPGFCNAYSRSGNAGYGLTSGKWWLPSIGELLMIFANKNKVNVCLQLITGATTLDNGWHWASSETGENAAWILHLGLGQLDGGIKTSRSYSVRPVSAFIK